MALGVDVTEIRREGKAMLFCFYPGYLLVMESFACCRGALTSRENAHAIRLDVIH